MALIADRAIVSCSFAASMPESGHSLRIWQLLETKAKQILSVSFLAGWRPLNRALLDYFPYTSVCSAIERVIDFDAEIANRTFHHGVVKKGPPGGSSFGDRSAGLSSDASSEFRTMRRLGQFQTPNDERYARTVGWRDERRRASRWGTGHRPAECSRGRPRLESPFSSAR